MSGYLEVKFPFKSSRSLNPWKTWKKQWCILRPCPLEENCAILAFHSSFGVCINSSLRIPPGSVLCRTRSKSKPYAFAVFSPDEFQKPQIFLGGQSESDSQLWMTKIRTILNGLHQISVQISGEKSFKVSFIDNNFTRKCNLLGVYGVIAVQADGLIISAPDRKQEITLQWHQLHFVTMYQTTNDIDKGRICLVKTNKEFSGGSGCIYMFCLAALELVTTVQEVTEHCPLVVDCKLNKADHWLIKNEEYLSKCKDKRSPNRLTKNVSIESDRNFASNKQDLNKQTSLRQILEASYGNNLDFSSKEVTTKHNVVDEAFVMPSIDEVDFRPRVVNRLSQHRQSNDSIGSGIYEEIIDAGSGARDENLYESLQAYCSCSPPRRPPPLPPRRTPRVDSTSDSGLDDHSCHSSPPRDGSSDQHEWGLRPRPPLRCCATTSNKHTCSDDRGDKLKQTFSVFRKRIKSDSRVIVKDRSLYAEDPLHSDKWDNLKSATVPRKKRFDFNVTPSKSIDLMRHFRKAKSKSKTDVSKVIFTNDLAKSCECLNRTTDNVNKVIHHRCSKSVDNLDLSADVPSPSVVRCLNQHVTNEEDDGQDLSMLYEEKEMSDIRHNIVQMLMSSTRSVVGVEDEYLPMSPAGYLLPELATGEEEEHHYMVMTSPLVDKC